MQEIWEGGLCDMERTRASICYGNSALLLLLPASSNIIPQQEKEMSFSKSTVSIPATVLKLDFLQELYGVFLSGFFPPQQIL